MNCKITCTHINSLSAYSIQRSWHKIWYMFCESLYHLNGQSLWGTAVCCWCINTVGGQTTGWVVVVVCIFGGSSKINICKLQIKLEEKRKRQVICTVNMQGRGRVRRKGTWGSCSDTIRMGRKIWRGRLIYTLQVFFVFVCVR